MIQAVAGEYYRAINTYGELLSLKNTTDHIKYIDITLTCWWNFNGL